MIAAEQLHRWHRGCSKKRQPRSVAILVRRQTSHPPDGGPVSPIVMYGAAENDGSPGPRASFWCRADLKVGRYRSGQGGGTE